MKSNVGSLDRIIRVLFAIYLFGVYFSGLLSGILQALVLIVAIVLMLTGAIGFCGLYRLLGINTNRVDDDACELCSVKQ